MALPLAAAAAAGARAAATKIGQRIGQQFGKEGLKKLGQRAARDQAQRSLQHKNEEEEESSGPNKKMLGCGCCLGILVVIFIFILSPILFSSILPIFFFTFLSGFRPVEASPPGTSIAGAPRGCPIKAPITTPFGINIPDYPEAGQRGDHDGVDLGDGPGTSTPIHATLDGVVSNGSTAGGGNYVEITHPTSGFSVMYKHMPEFGNALPGTTVAVGDIVGTEDSSGNYLTSEHVHYEVYFQGNPVNPVTYMPAQLNFTQPANNDFSSMSSTPSEGWGICDVLPEDVPPPAPPSPPGSNTPPNQNTCGGQYTFSHPIGNFGDPNCDFSREELYQILQTIDSQHADFWFYTVIPCESGYNPNAFNSVSTAGQALGLYQMGHGAWPQYGLDYQIADPATEFDRGDVEWRLQTRNAINYHHQVIGGAFTYWACAL